MKLKNITSSDKELINAFTGERITVKPGKTIELDRASYNSNVFKLIKDIEKKEELNSEKEVE